MRLKKPASAIFKSASAAGTRRAGSALAKKLRRGDVVALFGDLGAGKTTFVKGLGRALGAKESGISSPTFALIHEYQAKMPVFHLDWYRLEGVKNVDTQFALDCFDGNGVTLVEWAGKAKDVLPDKRIDVEIRHLGGDKREIRITDKR